MPTGIFVNGRPYVSLFDRLDARIMEQKGSLGGLSPGQRDYWARKTATGERPSMGGDRVREIMSGEPVVQPRTAAQAADETRAKGLTVENAYMGADGSYAFASRPVQPAAGPAVRAMEEPQPKAEADLDGDGIPDGAEVTRTVKTSGDAGESTTTAKWIHKARRRTDEEILRDLPARERLGVRSGLESRDTVRHRRAVEIMDRERAADQTAIAAEERGLDRAMEIEKTRLQHVQPEAIRSGALRDVTATKEEGLTARQKAEIEEQGRQFDTNAGEKPKPWTYQGQAFITYNGQIMKLDGQPNAMGHQVVRDPETNEVLGVLQADGTFKFDPKRARGEGGGSGGVMTPEDFFGTAGLPGAKR